MTPGATPRGGRRRAAVLGSPIAHSLSPVLHRAAYQQLGLEWTYEAIEVRAEGLAAFLDSCDESWAGVSLTMPLKRAVLPLLDEASELVRLVGAANTVLLGDSRIGHNTDVAGVVAALQEGGAVLGSGPSGSGEPERGAPASPGGHPDRATPDRATPDRATRAVVVGAGATAASTLAALRDLGISDVRIHARRPEAVDDLRPLATRLGIRLRGSGWPDRLPDRAEAPLVVSTVPASASVGLVASIPPDPGLLLDVAYDPWPPPLAAAWRATGGSAVSGERMLLHQALGQVRLMTRLEPDLRAMDEALGAELTRRQATPRN